MNNENSKELLERHITLKNQTLLGSLCQSLIKCAEDEKTPEDGSTASGLRQKILEEVLSKNYSLNHTQSRQQLLQSIYGTKFPVSVLETGRDYNIFYLLSQSEQFNFLYDNSKFQARIKNFSETDIPLVFKVMESYPLKHSVFFNTNHSMNLAIIKNNQKFLDVFTPLYLSSTDSAHTLLVRESIKIALNSGTKSFLDKLTPTLKDYVRSMKNAQGRNAAYYCRTLEMCDYLAEHFQVKPVSEADWFEKSIYPMLELKTHYSAHAGAHSDIDANCLTSIKEAYDRQIDLESYVPKKKSSSMEHLKQSSPLWLLLAKSPSLLPKVEPLLNPNSRDSMNQDFLCYLLNMLKKSAPSTKDDGVLACLESMVKSGKYDLERPNLEGMSTAQLLKATLTKETRLTSIKLENYKKFCEKIYLAHESQKLLEPKLVEPSAPKKKMKI